MNKSLSQIIEEMRHLDLTLRLQLEAAETWVPQINQLVENLRRLGLLQDMMLLGDVIHSNCYNPLYGPHDSGQLLQAAFGIGFGGFGVIRWDTEEYCAFFRQTPSSAASDELRIRLLSYPECDDATRGLLLPQVRPLLDQIVRIAGI